MLLVVFLAAGCKTTAPSPKRPDESRRVPINKTIPPELAARGQAGK